MKKILAVIACTALFSAVSCGKEKPEKMKERLVGEWSCETLGGTFVFDEADELHLRIDMSHTMYIDKDGTAHLTGYDADFKSDCTFDGTTYSFGIGEGEERVDVLTMTRKSGSSDSVYGEYTINSGMIHDDLAELYGAGVERFGAVVSDNRLEADVRVCGYAWDGERLTLSDGDLTVFGVDKNEAAYEMTLENGDMTLKNENETLVLKKLNASEGQN